MSPARSDDPLRRVTLNLYEADCQELEKHYGHGWTTVVRDTIHERMKALKPIRRTLGDLDHG